MKFVIILIYLLFVHSCFSQQLLVKIEMENKYKIGYGVEMYYVFNNVDEFKKSISNISMFTERDILNAFCYPLVEPGTSIGVCEPFDTLQKRNSDYIQKYRRIIIEKNNLKVSISISYAFIEYCSFDLSSKYWGSYDVSFSKAAVITAYKKYRKKIAKATLNDIESLLKKIPN